MPRHAIAVIGADRPGIVAAVTGALAGLGCNIEDSSMALLRGNFSMMLVVDGVADTAALEAAMATSGAALDVLTSVRPVSVDTANLPARRPYVVSVYGADHTGIVHGITSLLAGRGVNITDVVTRLVGEADSVYSMLLEVDLPDGLDADGLATDLATEAHRLGVTAVLHPDDPDIL